jgi:hypothetical protein
MRSLPNNNKSTGIPSNLIHDDDEELLKPGRLISMYVGSPIM